LFFCRSSTRLSRGSGKESLPKKDAERGDAPDANQE